MFNFTLTDDQEEQLAHDATRTLVAHRLHKRLSLDDAPEITPEIAHYVLVEYIMLKSKEDV